MPVVSGAPEALAAWRDNADALPWARWLADLRRSLDDPNGWSNAYILTSSRELLCSGLFTEEIQELARESRPLLANLLREQDHRPWPVPAMWWRDQIRNGQREGRYHVAVQMAVGADDERPNGARIAANALAQLQTLHDVNNVYYADRREPMDAAAITGTHECRDLYRRIEALVSADGQIAENLLRSVGETVEIPESVLAENRRLRQELGELRARLDSMQVQMLEIANLADDSNPEEDP